MGNNETPTRTLEQIKVYFPLHRTPFVIPYFSNDRSVSIGNQVKQRIDAIAVGMKRTNKDWFIVPAVKVDEYDRNLQLIHGDSLTLLADGFIVKNQKYLVLWMESSGDAGYEINSGVDYIYEPEMSYNYWD